MKQISDYLTVPLTHIGKLSASLFNMSLSKLINVEIGERQSSSNINIGAGVIIGVGVGISSYLLISKIFNIHHDK